MVRVFVAVSGFETEWVRLRLGDEVRRGLEQELLRNPGAGDLIKESGGIRKIRFAIPGRGKSSGIRVFYYDYPQTAHLFLMAVIKKGERENLSKAERNALREAINRMIAEHVRQLGRKR